MVNYSLTSFYIFLFITFYYSFFYNNEFYAWQSCKYPRQSGRLESAVRSEGSRLLRVIYFFFKTAIQACYVKVAWI